MKPARIGVLGCGKVSPMYLPNLQRSPALEVVALADLDPAVAHSAGDTYQLPVADSIESLLADRSIDIVVNLTPIAAHVPTTQAALAAGKHVYSEKSLARTVADAQELLAEADRRGLVLACAPDTLLGSGFQTARRAFDTGRIGRAVSATAAMYRFPLRARTFYTAGPLAFFDMAPYYLSALVSLLGPAAAVSATVATWPDDGSVPDEPAAGATVALTGVIEFASGLAATLTLAWGVEDAIEVPVIEIYGSRAVLSVPNPNTFGDAASVRGYAEPTASELPVDQPSTGNLRGLGVAEMALALHEGRTPRASGELAAHVVDIVAGLVEAGDSAQRVRLTTTCTPPPPLAAELRAQLIG